jgi:hypothetical protein
VVTALDALLGGLIDYAGLFPPAALDMPAAVRSYAEHRTGRHAHALGTFVVPASRLQELADERAAFGPAAGPAWPLSVVAGERAADDVVRTLGFQSGLQPVAGVVIVAIEARASSVEDVARLSALVPDTIRLALEVPLSLDRSLRQSLIDAVHAAGRMAKVRTGGVTADAVPPSRALAEFIWDGARARVPFKATAGLHHPVRSERRLTYAPDSPTAMMHGFVNVFGAAALAWRSVEQPHDAEPPPDLLAILDERDASAFEWDRSALRWRGRLMTAGELVRARGAFARGFGSCSFAEPIADLGALGWFQAGSGADDATTGNTP